MMCIQKDDWIVRLAVGLAVVLGGAGLTCGQRMLIDDFDDRNDDGWRHIYAGRNLTPDWDCSSQEYTLTGDADLNLTVASGWEASLVDPQFNNGFIEGKLRANADDSIAYLIMRGYEVGGWWGAYFFYPSPGGESFVLWEDHPSDPDPIQMILDNPSIPVNVGEDWILEAGAVGNQLSLKVWRPGEPEPAEPQWTVVDPTPISAGGIGVGVSRVDSPLALAVSATFDDIYFTHVLPADFDGDGDVDGDDFLAWQSGFGTLTGAQKSDGDYDNDGDVDGDDFLGWQAEFGSGSGEASAVVPEPTSMATVFLMAAVGTLLRVLREYHRANLPPM